MSMDDVHEQVRALTQELEAFNGGLRGTFNAVKDSHANVSPLWDDTMRREYDQTWLPLDEAMQDYVQRVGPQYVDLLIERLRHLEAYLHGHGA